MQCARAHPIFVFRNRLTDCAKIWCVVWDWIFTRFKKFKVKKFKVGCLEFRCLVSRWALSLKPRQQQADLFRARSFIAKHGVLLVIFIQSDDFNSDVNQVGNSLVSYRMQCSINTRSFRTKSLKFKNNLRSGQQLWKCIYSNSMVCGCTYLGIHYFKKETVTNRNCCLYAPVVVVITIRHSLHCSAQCTVPTDSFGPPFSLQMSPAVDRWRTPLCMSGRLRTMSVRLIVRAVLAPQRNRLVTVLEYYRYVYSIKLLRPIAFNEISFVHSGDQIAKLLHRSNLSWMRFDVARSASDFHRLLDVVSKKPLCLAYQCVFSHEIME